MGFPAAVIIPASTGMSASIKSEVVSTALIPCEITPADEAKTVIATAQPMTIFSGSEKFSAAAVPLIRPTRTTTPAIITMSFIGFLKLPRAISANMEIIFLGDGESIDCQFDISIPAESIVSSTSSGRESSRLSAPLDS